MNNIHFLQLFADNTMTTETAGLSDEMKAYYEMRLIDNAEPNLVHDQFGDKYPIPQNGGKTIEFRKYSPLPKALKGLTEGVTPDGSNLEVTAVTAAVNQYGDWVQLSDLLELTAVDRNVEQCTKLLGAQAGRTLDTITREVLCGGTNVLYAPKKASDGTETEITSRKDLTADCKLTTDLVFKAAAQLKSMNANPIDGAYVAIVHPYVAYDLMRSADWIDVHKYADPESLFTGELGKLGGVRFVESTEAKIIGPADIFPGVPRLTLKTALDSTGSTALVLNESVSSEEAAALTERLKTETVKIYVGGEEATVASVTAGSAGSAKLTVGNAVKDKAAGTLLCGTGAGKDGSAVFCTLMLGANAYGITEIQGGGLQHIVKQLGYGDDPLNQRSSCGWKATKAAKRLVEAYMVRVESANSYSAKAKSN